MNYKEKAEDMREQVKQSETPRQFPDMSEAKVAIVYTSMATLDDEMCHEWRAGMVPMMATVDAGSVRDRSELDQVSANKQ